MLLVGNWLLLGHFSFLILAAVAVATRFSFAVASWSLGVLSDQPSEPSFGGL